MKITRQYQRPLLHCFVIATAIAGLGACTNTVQYGQETRSETIRTEIGTADLLSGAQRMINKMLASEHVSRITAQGRPTLAYLPLVDQTDENLNLSPLNANIQQQINSFGRFQNIEQSKVVAQHQAMLTQLDFRAVNLDTAGSFADQVAADLLLHGTINNVIRTKSNTKEVYYRVSLTLWDNKSRQVIWQDDSEHLKTRKKAIFGL